MKTYHHILLVTDLKQGSDILGCEAIRVAEKYGARLSVLAIYQPLSSKRPLDLTIKDKLNIHEMQQRLSKYGRQIVVPPFDLRFAVGDVVEMVPRLAKEMYVDMVMVSAQTSWAQQLENSDQDQVFDVLSITIQSNELSECVGL